MNTSCSIYGSPIIHLLNFYRAIGHIRLIGLRSTNHNENQLCVCMKHEANKNTCNRTASECRQVNWLGERARMWKNGWPMDN